MTWGSGQASLSAGFGSSLAVGHTAAAGRGELSLHRATALLGSLQHHQCQHSPDFSALALCISLASSRSGSSWGRWDTGARHPSLGEEPTLESVCWRPRSWGAGFLLTWGGTISDRAGYLLFASREWGLGTR